MPQRWNHRNLEDLTNNDCFCHKLHICNILRMDFSPSPPGIPGECQHKGRSFGLSPASYCHLKSGMAFHSDVKDIRVTIGKAGRVVLPKELREQLSLQPGDVLRVKIRGDGLMLLPDRGRTGFVRRGKALVFTAPGDAPLEVENVQAILKAAREQTGRAMTATLAKPKPKR